MIPYKDCDDRLLDYEMGDAYCRVRTTRVIARALRREHALMAPRHKAAEQKMPISSSELPSIYALMQLPPRFIKNTGRRLTPQQYAAIWPPRPTRR